MAKHFRRGKGLKALLVFEFAVAERTLQSQVRRQRQTDSARDVSARKAKRLSVNLNANPPPPPRRMREGPLLRDSL